VINSNVYENYIQSDEPKISTAAPFPPIETPCRHLFEMTSILKGVDGLGDGHATVGGSYFVFIPQTQVYCINIIAVHRHNNQQRFINEDNHGDCCPVNADFSNNGSEFPTAISTI
jgi:hypothetical protein